MNKIFFWLVFFAPAFFFESCIKPHSEAFPAPPGLKAADTQLADSFSIELETYKLDTISFLQLANDNEDGYLMVGSYSPFSVLDSIRTEGYFQFLPEAENYPLICPPKDSILDQYTEASMTLKFDKVYGKFGNNQFGLYKLTSDLDGNRTHFADEPSPTFEPTPFLTTINASRTGSVIKIDANGLGRQIIASWKQLGSFTDDRQFLNLWKGFALKSLDSVNQLTRFDMAYSGGNPSPFLEITYRVKEDGVPVKKSISFRTNRTTVQYYKVQQFPSYVYPFKGGLSISATGNKAGVQGLSGLATKIWLPGIMDWKAKQTGKLKVFKAELEIIPDDPGSQPPPEYLYINHRKDFNIPNENDRSTVVYNDEAIFYLQRNYNLTKAGAMAQTAAKVFSFDNNTNKYKCNISSYIQGILDGEVTSNELNIYSAQWKITANRMLISPGAVKLKVYYVPI